MLTIQELTHGSVTLVLKYQKTLPIIVSAADSPKNFFLIEPVTGADCQDSSDCNINAGLCCRLQRKQKQQPRKVGSTHNKRQNIWMEVW
jgi:hypothetical protein